MKTLGQIAFEEMMNGYTADVRSDWNEWGNESSALHLGWEAAAQAVRAAVIEECAKVCEENAEPYDMHPCSVADRCAQAIRSLK